MGIIKLVIKGISFNQIQEGIYALLLEERESGFKLPVIIGGLEAQTISVALGKDEEKKQTFIYSLFANFFKVFDISLEKIVIYKFQEGVFFSYLVCNKAQNKEKIYSRASHGLAIAIYFEIPIYIEKEVFNKYSFSFELNEFFENKKTKEFETFSQKDKTINHLSLKTMNIESLNILLKKAIEEESYEFAALIKKEIEDKKN